MNFISQIFFNVYPPIIWANEIQYRPNVSWQSWLKTRSLILDPFENWESSFEARVSSFEYRVLRHSVITLKWTTINSTSKEVQPRDKTIDLNKPTDLQM